MMSRGRARTAEVPDEGTGVDLRWFYQHYYAGDPASGRQTSSHWAECSRKFEVELDGEGRAVRLRGYGFGELQPRRPVQRAMSWLTILSYLAWLPNRAAIVSLLKPAVALARRMGLAFTYDAFRQVCSLALIDSHLSEAQRGTRLRVLLIGDGYGFLGALVKGMFPRSTVVFVDLGKVLLFQAYHCQRVYPDRRHLVIHGGDQEAIERADFVYCPADRLEDIGHLTYDLAVNIASMQEMSMDVVAGYFGFLRAHMAVDALFYCCNRERKQLVGGEVQEFDRYPWSGRDVHLVDGACPWHRYYLAVRRGPCVLGRRWPLVNYFDGPHRHRLTRLARS